MKLIEQDEVSSLLSMAKCIDIMEATLADLATGKAKQSLRSVFPIDDRNVLGMMPGLLIDENIVGTKMITVFPENHEQGLPSHQGFVFLFDAQTGKPLAMVDAEEITTIRTAAVSAVATHYLADKSASVLTVLGTGLQARSHIDAMLQVRPITDIHLWGRSKDHADHLQKELQEKYELPIYVHETVQSAVQHADIICTVTASIDPILRGEWIKSGAHINAVGACRASDRELDSALVKQSQLFVDRIESAVHEAGDYLIPLEEGEISADHILGELGDLIVGKVQGRKTKEEITLFKSLGLAIEDVAVAHFIYKQSKQGG
ncbi:ornithine cyclodeaminase family protein [Hazenella sp. IB182353]|uniref:ornithine cyclodeaminase family protein n=1 Tax=Polycladospora coralii TaxID=2771432 RepID=UPI00174681CC|nr:ornithine cyclodeaminase family protein [Polycladospora coralii]MBS7532012.1 ornithine cyclodeaminase family protein [Polycladospora coralii]